MNPRTTDYNVDALTTAPSQRLGPHFAWMLVLCLLCLCSNLNNFNYKPQVESRQQHLAIYTERHLRLVAIMIEATSRSALILVWTTVRCLPVRHNRDPDEIKLHLLRYNWTTASSVMKHKSLSSRRDLTSKPPSN